MGLFFINNSNISLVAASENEEAQTQFQFLPQDLPTWQVEEPLTFKVGQVGKN